MTRPRYWMPRVFCKWFGLCEVDWLHHRLTGQRRCEHCRQPIKPITVGDLFPDAGD